MSDVVSELVADLRQLSAEVLKTIESIPAEKWGSLTPAENWPVAFTVRHIGQGFRQVEEWIGAILAGQPITIMGEEIQAINAVNVEQYGNSEPEQAFTFVETQIARLEKLVAGLSEDQLTANVPMKLLNDQPVTIPFILSSLLVRHTNNHLASLRQALTN